MAGELTQAGNTRAVAAGVGQAQSAVSGMYVMLLTALPASPKTATLATYAAQEVTTAGYARQAVTWGAPTGNPAVVANSADMLYGPFTADPPNVTHWALCTTSLGTGGSVLAYGDWTAARDGVSGDSLKIAAGNLTVQVGNP